jgi:hypothetical protein
MPSAKHPADLNGLGFMAFVQVFVHSEGIRHFHKSKHSYVDAGLLSGNHRS